MRAMASAYVLAKTTGRKLLADWYYERTHMEGTTEVDALVTSQEFKKVGDMALPFSIEAFRDPEKGLPYTKKIILGYPATQEPSVEFVYEHMASLANVNEKYIYISTPN